MTTRTLTLTDSRPHFRPPNKLERVLNRAFGGLIALGGGFAHNRVLEVRGRRSGKLYRTPVNLLVHEGEHYLVAPRGRTQWVRNVEVTPEISLRRGKRITRYRVEPLPLNERAPILQVYLRAYRAEVSTYFGLQADADIGEFEAVAARHPVFRLRVE
ncbi:MAG: nitroreductase family deazaflavin-dependent oxidoreductase [Myxococcales bacterium]|nr:nitroreductase family deazaflavin-dependent oxidoreductase [Myxococcales bacterium]